MPARTIKPSIDIQPLTPERWRDLAALFETNATTRSCWCMWFRQTSADYQVKKGAKNKAAFKRIVERAAVPPGLLAYIDGEPVGWCAVAPRDEYPRVNRAPSMKPIDDRPAWAITCFFVRRTARGAGITRALLRAAVQLARRHGATLIEGYPMDPAAGPVSVDAAYHGVLAVFEQEGFTVAARRSEKRPIVRYDVPRTGKRS